MRYQAGVAQRKTLTEQQVGILRWISEGCPDGVFTRRPIDGARYADMGQLAIAD
jgi:hypothetical protein